MLDNLRLIILTLVGLVIIWFIIMVVDMQIFLHTDADEVVFGTVSLSRTDIGDKCGAEYVNSATMVDYKLSPQAGQIMYLCPMGFSPIRNKVIAITVSDSFRKQLTPAQQIKVITFYPVTPVVAAPAATSTAQPATAAPAPAVTQPMSNTPPPVQNTSTPTPTSATAPDSQ